MEDCVMKRVTSIALATMLIAGLAMVFAPTAALAKGGSGSSGKGSSCNSSCHNSCYSSCHNYCHDYCTYPCYDYCCPTYCEPLPVCQPEILVQPTCEFPTYCPTTCCTNYCTPSYCQPFCNYSHGSCFPKSSGMYKSMKTK